MIHARILEFKTAGTFSTVWAILTIEERILQKKHRKCLEYVGEWNVAETNLLLGCLFTLYKFSSISVSFSHQQETNEVVKAVRCQINWIFNLDEMILIN